ncbi:unnamed protein product [Owenia fusiformis]|uniref:Gamma-aminobutyric acid type B receptor subunit 2 n=1 Tax=Owenia fusiformis TaxID=6347 RepID=A0A8J1XS48_OWEFU|nr:unnamed protein product [Owenia fusiformis]
MMISQRLTICVIVVFGLLEVQSVTDLYLLGLFPMEGAWYGGRSLLASVQMGLDHINGRSDILPGYRLNIMWNDTKCNPGHGTNVMYELLYSAPTKIMIIGAACSAVSQATSQASHNWNIVQISYASVSPALSDKTRFPKFFRVSAPDVTVNPSRIEIMKQFNWNRIATIHQSLELFSAVTTDLVARLKDENMTLVTSEIFSNDPSLQVESLKNQDARIIVGGFYQDMARKVFCEAYKNDLYGPRYQWIVVGWWDDEWWSIEDDSITCTPEEVATAAEGYIATGIVYLNPVQEAGIGGITPDDFLEEYGIRTNHEVLFGAVMAPQGYDAAWAVALGLHDTMEQLAASGSSKGLEDFDYHDSELTEMVFESMKRVSFTGVRGALSFNDNFDPVGMVQIDRKQGGVKQKVGFYHPDGESGNKLQWSSSSPLVWEGGSPPKDATQSIDSPQRVSLAVYGTMCTLSAIGIIVAIVFLIINSIYRNVRIIKMSSPLLNNLILLGCIFSYAAVFMQALQPDPEALFCRLNAFSLTIGFSMAFGALFSKTWRVHAIFTNVQLKKKVVKDSQLIIMTMGLVLINSIILIVWMVVDPLYEEAHESKSEEKDGGDTIVHYQHFICDSEKKIYFLVTLYGIQGLLLIFGCFLAWETRKVKIPVLNDSQNIGICIYNVVVLSVIGVTLTMVLEAQPELQYAFTSCFIILGTSMTQGIIFVPKLLKLRQSRKAGSEDTEDEYTGRNNGGTRTEVTAIEDKKAIELREELNVTKAKLSAMEKMVKDLKNEKIKENIITEEGSTA